MQIVISDILTSYKTYGDVGNPCLLILHGWQRSLSDWENIAEEISNKYYVILLDLPGFGGTSQPKRTYGTYGYADFVESFINKLELENITLMGHSFGGRIGIILGSKSSLLKRLVLVDSAGTERPNSLYNLLLIIAKPMSKIFPKSIVGKVKQTFGSKDYLRAGKMMETFKKVIAEDLSHLLGNIKIPTLVIWGSADKVLDVNITKDFRDSISDCEVRIVWGAGHHPHIDNKDQFITILEEFLNAK